jgi:hypothetical protein
MYEPAGRESSLSYFIKGFFCIFPCDMSTENKNRQKAIAFSFYENRKATNNPE